MLQIRRVLLLAAFAVAAAALGLTTNARASSDEEPNGTSLNGISPTIEAEWMGKIPASVDAADGQVSVHPGALFDGTNGTSLSGISATIDMKGMKLQADAQDADDDIEDIESSDDLNDAERGHVPG